MVILVVAIICTFPVVATLAADSDDRDSNLFDVLRRVSPAGSKGDRAFSQTLATLKSTFPALPKNSRGRLPPRTVRYMLHNHLAKRHGWLLRGLEHHGNGRSSWKALHEVSIIQHRSHAIKRALLDARVPEQGLSLKEVAALALALETLVKDESVSVLDHAYKSTNESAARLLSLNSIRKVLYQYVTIFTDGFKEEAYDADNIDEDVMSFVEDTLQSVIRKDGLDVNLLRQERFAYHHVWRVVEVLNQRFAEYQNSECVDMKQALMELDPWGLGRVPLKPFYRKGKASKYGFKESSEYLRKTGALDESDKENPMVVISNYVEGPGNCISTFQHFSVCCLPESVGMMHKLEQEVGASKANVKQLMSIVNGMTTSTVKAPRDLDHALVTKLEAVATHHGGLVPLHGRLFAQWLHFAFPYEYPYPSIVTSMSGLSSIHRFGSSHWVSKEQLLKAEKISEKKPQFMAAWTENEVLPLVEEDMSTENIQLSSWSSITDVVVCMIVFLGSVRFVQVCQRRSRCKQTSPAEKISMRPQKQVCPDGGKVHQHHQKSGKQKDSTKEAPKETGKRVEKTQKATKTKATKVREEKELSCRKSKASVCCSEQDIDPNMLSSRSELVDRQKATTDESDSPKTTAIPCDFMSGESMKELGAYDQSRFQLDPEKVPLHEDLESEQDVGDVQENSSTTIQESISDATEGLHTPPRIHEQDQAFIENPDQPMLSMDVTDTTAHVFPSDLLAQDGRDYKHGIAPMQHQGQALDASQESRLPPLDSESETFNVEFDQCNDVYESAACKKLVEKILPRLQKFAPPPTFAPPPGLEMFGPAEMSSGITNA